MSDEERREDTDQEQPDEEAREPEEPEPAEEGAEEEQPAEEPGPDEETAEQPPPPDMDVFDILRMSLGMFAQEAWVAMGLQTRPGATETRRDLRCARIAIDMVEVVGEKLGEEADPDEQRTINQILTDLRVNFVRVSSKSEEQS